MEFTHVGRLGLVVSRLCLGTMNFGPHTSGSDSHTIMDTAVAYGINFFDTANTYGRHLGVGTTERIIGEWFAKGEGRRDSVVLATKVWGTMGEQPNEGRLSKLAIVRQCEASLARLQTDRIDLYQMHHIDRDSWWDEIWEAMDQLKADGKIALRRLVELRRVAHRTRERAGRLAPLAGPGDRAVRLQPARADDRARGDPGRSRVRDGVDLLQPARRRAARRRAREAERGPALHRLHARGDRGEPRPARSWEQLCKELGARPSDVALAWLLHQPAVTAPIIGPRTEEQLLSSMRALDVRLDEDALAKLDEIFPGPGGEAPEAYAW